MYSDALLADSLHRHYPYCSGGQVVTQQCCKSTDDFPTTCGGLIGACGCSSANSHEIAICQCPQGTCYDGSHCVATIAPTQSPTMAPTPVRERTCTNSGGTFELKECCTSVDDLPDTCGKEGACSCSSGNSHEIGYCECGDGR